MRPSSTKLAAIASNLKTNMVKPLHLMLWVLLVVTGSGAEPDRQKSIDKFWMAFKAQVSPPLRAQPLDPP